MRHFFLGLGVGLIGGVLLAPKPGTETREYLGKKADEGLDYVKTCADDLAAKASDLLDQSKSAASNLMDQAKTSASDIKSTATGMVDKTKNAASDVLHKGAHALRTQPDVEAMSNRFNT